MHIRPYLFVIGIGVLVALYFDWAPLLFAIAGLLLFEGITNLALARFTPAGLSTASPDSPGRFHFEADRLWRLIVGGMLGLSYGLFPDALWFIPWFVGFAVAGAGLSGVCPMLVMLRSAGFR